MSKPKLIVILGSTASGKSDIAVDLARNLNGLNRAKGTIGRTLRSKVLGEVISADSRQVYKGLDIGTGKITKREMRSVPHYLLDVANPKKQFSVSDYIKLTNNAITKIIKSKKIPIVCGGTGFYIDALLGDKQIPEVPPNLKLRKRLEKKSVAELFKILKKLDPERAKEIDAKNPRRLVRAIEICKAIGKVPKIESRIMNYEVCKIGIKIEDGELKKKIERRIEKWFKQGLIKEVQNLHKKGLSWKRMSEIGLEYKLVANFLKFHKVSRTFLDMSGLKKEMAEKTWQYAKRQMTWFKRDKKIIWLPPKISLIKKEVKKFL